MANGSPLSIGVAIVTLNAEREVEPALRAVLSSPEVTRCLVLDSTSTDNTVALAQKLGAEVFVLPRSEFNHGATREKARKLLATDVVVLLTQDVIPEPGFIAELVKPLLQGQAAVAYSRQLPHVGAGFFEAFPREFNYPATSQIRSLGDAAKYGVYTFFCSDSSAAYVNEALDKVGGFEPTLTNEDYFAVARLLRAGERIAYAAESRVRHSHQYTLAEEFRRYFDTGYVRAENKWVNELAGHAEGRGALFARELFARLCRQSPWLVPYAILQTAVKWLGYRVGYFSIRMPTWWCRSLSSQRYYWNSVYCRHRPRS